MREKQTLAVDEIRERQAWLVFAGARFDVGSDRERSLHHLLRNKVQAVFDALSYSSRRSGGGVDFDYARLLLTVVEALDRGCVYCPGLLAVDDFEVVYEIPPTGRVGTPASRGLANVAVCCTRCGRGKGSLSGDEWRDVLAALRAADELAAAACLAALVAGYRRTDADARPRRYSARGAGRQ